MTSKRDKKQDKPVEINNIYNKNNKLITENDLYIIFEKVGFKNARQKIKINDISLYQKAFVHSSYVRHPTLTDIKRPPELTSDVLELFPADFNYENMEFLGDRCLELAISFYIYRRYPDSSQGDKTILKTKLVDTNQLKDFATFCGFSPFIVLSKYVEEKTEFGRKNPRILEDVFEAFLCALFLDQNKNTEYLNTDALAVRGDFRLVGCGFQIVNAFVENLLEKLVDFEKLLVEQTNFKNQLLHYFQRTFSKTPEYRQISQEGPSHQRVFTVAVVDKVGKIVGQGFGRTKQDAEQEASKNALIYYGELVQ